MSYPQDDAVLSEALEIAQARIRILESNIVAVLEGLDDDAVRVHEGGAAEDILMSLSCSVVRLQKKKQEQGQNAVELFDELVRLKEDHAKLYESINTPHTRDFLESVRLEAAHARERWSLHDESKTDTNWFWLIGLLAGKVLTKPEKALHHIITTAAACLNWHMQKMQRQDKSQVTTNEA